MLRVVMVPLSHDYTYVPALPLALIELASGRSDRILLILAIGIVYVAPTVISLSYLLYRVSGRRLNGCVLYYCLVLCFLFIRLFL